MKITDMLVMPNAPIHSVAERGPFQYFSMSAFSIFPRDFCFLFPNFYFSFRSRRPVV